MARQIAETPILFGEDAERFLHDMNHVQPASHIDDHNPPHFHVWYDDYQAEITIKDGVVTGSLPRRALRLVYEWLDLHRDELMENWERLSNSEAAKKIEPLQ